MMEIQRRGLVRVFLFAKQLRQMKSLLTPSRPENATAGNERY
jgi:hypothetical protein